MPKETPVPPRRDREKADATRTPLADLAPDIPTRDADYTPMAAPAEPPPAGETGVIPDDDMLPESSATMPVAGAETDTAPANVRSRPNARKIAARGAAPAVPRTIAEMQAHDAANTNLDEEDTTPAIVPDQIFIPLKTLLLGAFIPFALLTLIPALLDRFGQYVGLSGVARSVSNFVVISAAAVSAFALGVRNWRVAFHDTPTDLHPRAVLELWERRSINRNSDIWATSSLWIVGGFVLLLLLTLVIAPFSYGVAATYIIPYLVLLIVTKAIGAFLFVGYLERGLLALNTRRRATIITGALYTAALAVANLITVAINDLNFLKELAVPFLLVTVAVGFGAAWIRSYSRSMLVAIAFQLLLLLFGFRA